jgi:hypothetical protein
VRICIKAVLLFRNLSFSQTLFFLFKKEKENRGKERENQRIADAIHLVIDYHYALSDEYHFFSHFRTSL